ncbi:MAG TPA: hypothetical protein VF426_14245 [Marmoricola sp.]
MDLFKTNGSSPPGWFRRALRSKNRWYALTGVVTIALMIADVPMRWIYLIAPATGIGAQELSEWRERRRHRSIKRDRDPDPQG